MITVDDIYEFIGDHKPPYLYNSNSVVPVYYSGPYWDREELVTILHSVLNGNWLSSGAKVIKFQRSFSVKFKAAFSHMVNSGSSANLIMIAALKHHFKWEDDSEIIVSPVGFPTTISTIYQNRLKPVFVDIEMQTLNFDVTKIEEKITSKTKAILVSPVLGNPPNMDVLLDICKRKNLLLVGDNCDSLGTKWDKKLLNEYYVAFSNSFYPSHHISCGQGGMVCTNDPGVSDAALSLLTWGRSCYCFGSANLLPNGTCKNRFSNWLEDYDGIIDHKYVFGTMGYNFQPLDLQGAIGYRQLLKFDDIEERRKVSKEKITEIFLNKFDKLRTVVVYPKADVSWFATPFICEEPGLKQKIVNHLEEYKIQTRNYFAGNILLHPGYKFLDDYKKYPQANKVLDSVFFVGAAPHYRTPTFQYIQEIVDKL